MSSPHNGTPAWKTATYKSARQLCLWSSVWYLLEAETMHGCKITPLSSAKCISQLAAEFRIFHDYGSDVDSEISPDTDVPWGSMRKRNKQLPGISIYTMVAKHGLFQKMSVIHLRGQKPPWSLLLRDSTSVIGIAWPPLSGKAYC